MTTRNPFLPLLLLAVVAGCAERSASPDLMYLVEIVEPADGAVFREGGLVRLEAEVATTGSEFDFSETVVVWSSDVAGVLSDATGDCTDDACWLSQCDATGTWPMVTELQPGSHVLNARALDLKGGRVEPTSTTIVVDVEEIEAPEIHLVGPTEGSEIVTGTDFELTAWISDDAEGVVEVRWSSSVHGLVHESEVGAPGTYSVACHAGGIAEPGDPCHLSPGTHLMTLVATDVEDDGGTSHSFLTLHVVGPDEGDADE